jgi:polar amino acid transport system substrate-binding protein
MRSRTKIPKLVWFWIILAFILPVPIENAVGEEAQQIIWIIHLIPAMILSYYWGIWGGLLTAIISPFLHFLWMWIEPLLTGTPNSQHNYTSILAATLLQIAISVGIGLLSSTLKKKQNEILHLMYEDPLTGMWNRRYFQKALEDTIRHGNTDAALFYLDLDRFKIVNDTYGHRTGDRMLKEVASRLIRSLEGIEAIVSRLDGDEFTIILPLVRNQGMASDTANRILHTLSEPFHFQHREIHISASIGIALYPKNTFDPETLCRYADIAMYEAKKNRNTCQFFSEQLNRVILEKANMETGLRKSLGNGELQLYYQPKFHLNEMRMVGAEALLRWHSTELGVIPPSEFIPVAEETGLIHVLGEWALRTVCEQNQRWIDEGHPPLRISVNVSVKQLQTEDIVKRVAEALSISRLSAQWLELELTESVFMDGNPVIVQQIQQLREMGVTISIDDFGAGYSSLAYLKSLPADLIKIDKSFILCMLQQEEGTAIVQTIINLGHLLKKRVLAEGIEDEDQLIELRRLGCDDGQGFYLSKPLSSEEFAHMLSPHLMNAK